MKTGVTRSSFLFSFLLNQKQKLFDSISWWLTHSGEETQQRLSCYKFLLPILYCTSHQSRAMLQNVTPNLVSITITQVFFFYEYNHQWQFYFYNCWHFNDKKFLAFTVIPEVKIFSSPPNRTQPIAAAINLTCEAWPKHEDVSYARRWIKYIQWYDTHGRQVGDKCLKPKLVKNLKCPLILKNLTIENFGNYTCEAENDYTEYCTRKSVEILHKGNNQIIPNTNNFGHGKYLLS